MKTYSVTDVGLRRRINQDYVFVSNEPVGNLPNLYIVADGMGGHNAGDYASRFVVKKVREYVEGSEETNPVSILQEAIQNANTLLLAESAARAELMGMGTTIVATTILGSEVYTANVGDSRMYMIKDSGIHQVTQDHSLVEEMVRLGQITKDVARVHPDKNIITRAIGAALTVQTDIFETELSEGCRLLMCTDGLTNMVEDALIWQIVTSDLSIEERACELVNAANEHGGKDNIAVIIIEPDTNEVKEC